MSLLSSTQGTPDRVLSLVQVLAAHGGSLPRDELLTWINPAFERGGAPRQTPKEAANQTWGAASSLGLAVAQDGHYALTEPAADWSRRAMADAVHDRLRALDDSDPDAVVLQVFTYIVVRSQHARGVGWLRTLTGKQLADAVDAHLTARDDTATDGRRFNDTKLAPLWRWTAFLGLSVDLPGEGDYPYVTERLSRELAREGLPIGQELPAATVLATIAKRMPYLDGGTLFEAMSERMGVGRNPRTLSPVLSHALRDLDEEGRIELGTRGDATGLVSLASDHFSRISSLQFVTLRPGLSDA